MSSGRVGPISKDIDRVQGDDGNNSIIKVVKIRFPLANPFRCVCPEVCARHETCKTEATMS